MCRFVAIERPRRTSPDEILPVENPNFTLENFLRLTTFKRPIFTLTQVFTMKVIVSSILAAINVNQVESRGFEILFTLISIWPSAWIRVIEGVLSRRIS